MKRGDQPNLKIEDLVMVDKRNMGTWRPSKKLYHKKAGPFPITKIVGKRAYRVQLPEGSQAHPTFHVKLLELYQVSWGPSRRQRPPTLEPIEGEVNYTVCAIVDSQKDNRRKGKPTEYLVLWEGYLNEEGMWEKYENIKRTAEEALAEYRAKNPNAD